MSGGCVRRAPTFLPIQPIFRARARLSVVFDLKPSTREPDLEKSARSTDLLASARESFSW